MIHWCFNLFCLLACTYTCCVPINRAPLNRRLGGSCPALSNKVPWPWPSWRCRQHVHMLRLRQPPSNPRTILRLCCKKTPRCWYPSLIYQPLLRIDPQPVAVWQVGHGPGRHGKVMLRVRRSGGATCPVLESRSCFQGLRSPIELMHPWFPAPVYQPQITRQPPPRDRRARLSNRSLRAAAD